jgi:uncharacterized protein (DUF1015 family)
MAEIKPIRGWRYNDSLAKNIDTLTSPLFDVVSDKQRKSLYQNPLNSIHLSVPEGPEAASRAGKLLQQWKKEGVIVQDKLPAIYVYYQFFKLAGSTKEYCRKGFISHIRTYDWDENVILRHENTIPKSVNDRVELLEKTELHVSPTHGLYTDETFALEKYMDEAISNPIYECEDYQGVRDVMGLIHDLLTSSKIKPSSWQMDTIAMKVHFYIKRKKYHKIRIIQETRAIIFISCILPIQKQEI